MAGKQTTSSPSPEDVTFGRACMAFGLVTREQLTACVANMQYLASQRRPVTLAQVMIARKLITADQYHQVVQRIRQYYENLRQQQQAARIPPMPPEITASGRYSQSQLARYAQQNPQLIQQFQQYQRATPEHAPDSSNKRPVHIELSQHKPSEDELDEAARSWEDASNIVEASYEVVAEPVISPRAVKERRDTGIRKILGVGEDADEFDFGPYRILGEIAAGGMGIIYRARSGDTGRTYALKALINVENATDKQLRRFIQEAQSGMRLDHPGIVKIHDLGIFENIPYFTMDLVEGKDLHHHLRQNTFSLEQLLEIVVHVTDAVHYAHQHGVIHRDLKPANVVVRDRDRFPVLTDFGLAKNLDSSFKLTAEGAMVGTPLFLSPEQVAGKANEVDGRCDVYGMGVMLYQILTGTMPFLGRNPYEVYRKVLEEDPTPPTQVKPSVTPELEKICLMALAKDRVERYQSALEMGEDLRRYLRSENVRAQLPTPAAVVKARREPEEGSSGGSEGDKTHVILVILIVVTIALILAGLSFIAYSLLTAPS